MYATRPTISATTAKMLIPELIDQLDVCTDERVVNQDKSINVVKMAVDYVWNLYGLASRLKIDEKILRESISTSTGQPDVMNTKYNTYLPTVRGISVYFFGDINKLNDVTTEIAVRCHDACCGSDVFGTDICTCRPYLIYAIQGCVDTAKRGGVGLIVYYHKEGRSLGEVTKFRVYNARKNQPGGDRPENYFKQTESIAGIRDARFQELAPDILLLLGIERVDWLLSMSNDKYNGMMSAGMQVIQRVSLPDDLVPSSATIEIAAKVASGYNVDSIQHDDVVHQLRTLEMIRVRTGMIYQLALKDKTRFFSLNLSRLDAVVDYVIRIGEQTYGDITKPGAIPYHSRWRHFDDKAVNKLMNKWRCDKYERCRRQLDLATISVLLDAGAGKQWHYITGDGERVDRSEGLAIATFDMFRDGVFSSDEALPNRVNSAGLSKLTFKQLVKGFQVNDNNFMVGLKGRYELLKRLGDALKQHTEYFGAELHRPGNVLDYILQHCTVGSDGKQHVSIKILWQAIIEGLENIWPGVSSGPKKGDCWVYSPLKVISVAASDMVPFHKLSQWLTYSLLEPIEQLDIIFDDMHLMTGLAEYRNGGLFIDFDVIIPKVDEYRRIEHNVGSEIIVEWRALTVCLLDELASRIRKKLNLTEQQFPLAKVLQLGTWTAGREIAREKRVDGLPPITIRSDGTVF